MLTHMLLMSVCILFIINFAIFHTSILENISKTFFFNSKKLQLFTDCFAMCHAASPPVRYWSQQRSFYDCLVFNLRVVYDCYNDGCVPFWKKKKVVKPLKNPATLTDPQLRRASRSPTSLLAPFTSLGNRHLSAPHSFESTSSCTHRKELYLNRKLYSSPSTHYP